MKIRIIKTVDRATQRTTKSDAPFTAGEIHLVSEEVGQLLIDKGFAEKVEKKPSI